MTLPQIAYLDEWILWMHSRRMSATGISERVRIITAFAAHQDVQPASATAIEIQRWIVANPQWSDGTACTYFGYLRAWYKWLQINDHRLDDPTIKVGSPRWPDRTPRPVSDNGVMRLLLARMHHRTRVMILLAILAGLRVSEIAKVRGEHIDVTVPSIWVAGKNRKARTLPLHPLLVEAAATMPTHGYWFPANATRPGEHVLGKSVSHIISLVMRRAEVAGTPHKLRHWFGTTLLHDGADLLTVKELLRHASVSTTQVYVQIPDARRHDAIALLDPWRGRHGGGDSGSGLRAVS
ncbi:MAG: tyrosine-type recombinase/integrase [Actinomycetota bacterium]|nr:tyrosine-type recombinase/integrase [Actinomycetota bacterium]